LAVPIFPFSGNLRKFPAFLRKHSIFCLFLYLLSIAIQFFTDYNISGYFLKSFAGSGGSFRCEMAIKNGGK